MKYTFNSKSFLKQLLELAYTYVYAVIVIIALEYFDMNYYISIFASFFTLITIIYIVIFIKYVKCSIDIIVNITNSKIMLQKKDGEFELNAHNINMIETVMSFPKYDDRSNWLPWDEFHYSIITDKDGTEYKITSFVLPYSEFIKYFPNIKKRKKIFVVP